MAAEPQQPSREATALGQVVDRLRARFPELPAAEVDAVVRGHYDGLAGSRIRDFLPVLIERGARDELSRRQPRPAD